MDKVTCVIIFYFTSTALCVTLIEFALENDVSNSTIGGKCFQSQEASDQSKCYAFPVVESHWSDGKAECSKINGSYKAIRSQLEQDTMVAAMLSANVTKVWLPGYIERPAAANWTWISDGTDLDTNISFWGLNQPHPSPSRDCVTAYPATDWKWLNFACTWPNTGFICERNLNNDSGCMVVSDFVLISNSSGRCFYLSNEILTFFEARQKCMLYNMTLATVESEDIYNRLSSIGISPDLLRTFYWVGLTRARWYWNTTQNEKEEILATFWHNNRPRFWDDQSCVSVQEVISVYLWTNVVCNSQNMTYLCEIDTPPLPPSTTISPSPSQTESEALHRSTPDTILSTYMITESSSASSESYASPFSSNIGDSVTSSMSGGSASDSSSIGPRSILISDTPSTLLISTDTPASVSDTVTSSTVDSRSSVIRTSPTSQEQIPSIDLSSTDRSIMTATSTLHSMNDPSTDIQSTNSLFQDIQSASSLSQESNVNSGDTIPSVEDTSMHPATGNSETASTEISSSSSSPSLTTSSEYLTTTRATSLHIQVTASFSSTGTSSSVYSHSRTQGSVSIDLSTVPATTESSFVMSGTDHPNSITTSSGELISGTETTSTIGNTLSESLSYGSVIGISDLSSLSQLSTSSIQPSSTVLVPQPALSTPPVTTMISVVKTPSEFVTSSSPTFPVSSSSQDVPSVSERPVVESSIDEISRPLTGFAIAVVTVAGVVALSAGIGIIIKRQRARTPEANQEENAPRRRSFVTVVKLKSHEQKSSASSADLRSNEEGQRSLSDWGSVTSSQRSKTRVRWQSNRYGPVGGMTSADQFPQTMHYTTWMARVEARNRKDNA